MVNEFQKMINLLNIVDEQHRLEGEDERDYCRSIICEVIKMLKKCSANAEGNKNNKQSKSGNSAKLPSRGTTIYAVTGTFHGSLVEAHSEGEARRLFHKAYNGESITHVIKRGYAALLT